MNVLMMTWCCVERDTDAFNDVRAYLRRDHVIGIVIVIAIGSRDLFLGQEYDFDRKVAEIDNQCIRRRKTQPVLRVFIQSPNVVQPSLLSRITYSMHMSPS